MGHVTHMHLHRTNALLAVALAALPTLLAAGEATNVVERPFVIYSDYIPGKLKGVPSGWMGDYRDLRLDLNWTNHPHTGASCIRFIYTAEGSRYSDMAGVMWQNPANNSGDIDGGVNLSGATQVTFWARGEKGKELIDAFTFGGTMGAYPDSDKTSTSYVRLKKEWTEYQIDISKCDLSYISSFFGWVAARFNNRNGFTIYLDDIVIE